MEYATITLIQCTYDLDGRGPRTHSPLAVIRGKRDGDLNGRTKWVTIVDEGDNTLSAARRFAMHRGRRETIENVVTVDLGVFGASDAERDRLLRAVRGTLRGRLSLRVPIGLLSGGGPLVLFPTGWSSAPTPTEALDYWIATGTVPPLTSTDAPRSLP